MNTANAPPATALTPAQRSKIQRTVFFALLVDIFSFTIILPLFPRLLEYYREREGGDPNSLFAWTLGHLDAFKALIGATGPRLDVVVFGGAVGSLFSFLQFAVSPLIGRLSDRFGRKRVLMLCMAGNLVSCALWIVAKPFWVFLASRIVGGISEGNVQLSVAIISDITTPATRSRGLALVGIAFALGFTFGPAIGAALASMDLTTYSPTFDALGLNPYSASALFAFVLILAEIGYLHVALPETLPRADDAPPTPSSNDDDDKNKAAAAESAPRSLAALSAIHFGYLFVFSGLEFTLPFLTYDLFQYTNMQQGRLLGYIGLVASLVQGGYTRRVGHRVGERRVAVQGILSCAAGFAVLALRPDSLLWVAATLLAFTSATVVTCLTTLASLELGAASGQGAGKRIDGAAMGAFRSWGQLGRALGPMAACALYWGWGARGTYLVGAALLLAVAARLAVVPVRASAKATKTE
ncbi:hypothetical protein H9P43_008897 [Blastocladiella emersonii ATCC 22665]|nr:hypothetical protein H9P43_008897 [Blastocladiella emersonii ATCC 22665]